LAALPVETKADWARGNNFLTRTFKVSQGDDVLLEGWQIIGWDPIEIGSAPGYSTVKVDTARPLDSRWQSLVVERDQGVGRWQRVECRANPHLRRSRTHCTFESANRTLNGDLQPNIDKIEIDRVKSQ